jgi:hypothetical protein
VNNPTEIELDILSSGQIKFRRLDKDYNDCMREILPDMVGEEEAKKLEPFFQGSEGIKVLLGDNFCG